MSKAVLMSIQPKWCELIANGKKTVEVRKTKPKLSTPFKVYIYCTKAREFFSYGGDLCAANDELYRLPTGEIKFGDSIELMCCYEDEYSKDNVLNGKVIGEFVCDGIYDIGYSPYNHGGFISDINGCLSNTDDLYKKSCLDLEEMFNYLSQGYGYGWNISNLLIYDKPKALSEFIRPCVNDLYCEECAMYSEFEDKCHNKALQITRPPQSWCYVEEWIP